MVTYISKIPNYGATAFDSPPCSILSSVKSMHEEKEKKRKRKKLIKFTERKKRVLINQTESVELLTSWQKGVGTAPKESARISWTHYHIWRPQKLRPMGWKCHSPPQQAHFQLFPDPTIDQTRQARRAKLQLSMVHQKFGSWKHKPSGNQVFNTEWNYREEAWKVQKEVSYFKRVYTVQATCAGNKPKITPTFPMISNRAAIGPTINPAEFNQNFKHPSTKFTLELQNKSKKVNFLSC